VPLEEVHPNNLNYHVPSEIHGYWPRLVAKALADNNITPEASQITRIAKNTVEIDDPEAAHKVLRLMDRLDDNDDVQNVSANFNISDEVMTQAEALA
jgi:transcriptional/translational regulatory protein YebC/TACO1